MKQNIPTTAGKYIFFCRTEDGDICLATKEDIETNIRNCEDNNVDPTFETIGKIKLEHFKTDMSPQQIEWFAKDLDKQTIDRAILASVQYITGY